MSAITNLLLAIAFAGAMLAAQQIDSAGVDDARLEWAQSTELQARIAEQRSHERRERAAQRACGPQALAQLDEDARSVTCTPRRGLPRHRVAAL